MAYWWSSGSGALNLKMTLEEARSGSRSGDCEGDVRALLSLPHIAAQVDAWDADSLRAELSEYGAWDEAELEDLDMCQVRMVWLACGNIAEDPESAYEPEKGGDKMPVLFRAEKAGPHKGEVTAVLPALEANPGHLTCYAHVGQHSEGSRGWYAGTRAATEAEYADLLRELRGIYTHTDDEPVELVVGKRLPSHR